MPSFEEYAAALSARDTIAKIVTDQMDRDRPRYRYGYVQSIDRVNRVCSVQFPEGGDFVTVQMGSLQPQKTGQIVRVAGLMGDRFVDDVMGPAIIDQGQLSVIYNIMVFPIFTGPRTGSGSLVWNNQVQSSSAWMGGYDQSGGGQGAWKEVDQYFQGGTWYGYSFYVNGPNIGIHRVTVDGAIGTTQGVPIADTDGYHASTYQASIGAHGGWTLQPGVHQVRITAVDKNASSTGYYGLLCYLLFFYQGPLT